MPFPPKRTPTKTTLIPALSAYVLCAGLVLIMSETAAPALNLQLEMIFRLRAQQMYKCSVRHC